MVYDMILIKKLSELVNLIFYSGMSSASIMWHDEI